ncbi:hypothetical protein MKW98_018414 [Papaver atlanticum]|uniref:Arabinogalactan peptide 23-like n=1 Tax=Papaver atlanticum TaxID=357466 RepID=A0AAD4XN23_9MAGN|nr:hypothetical protein MKW98_018414 [Papaver atlanticum]
MDMKKISCAVLLAVAASMNAALVGATDVQAPAPAPSGAAVAMPVVGSLVGASLVSFFAFYM